MKRYVPLIIFFGCTVCGAGENRIGPDVVDAQQGQSVYTAPAEYIDVAEEARIQKAFLSDRATPYDANQSKAMP